MKFKKLAAIVSILTIISIIFTACGKKEVVDKKVSYPEKPIKIIHYLPEGSPPDEMSRKTAEIFTKKLGWKFEFANEPGNRGADAENKVWAQPHDGYTLLGMTENVLAYSVYGSTPRTSKDWIYFASLQEYSGIIVKRDSKFNTIQELVEAAKANPGTIKVATPGEGMSFHLKLKIIEKVTGAEFKSVHYLGGIGLVEALYNGEVDAAIIPTGVMVKDMHDGKMKALTVTEEHAYDFGGNIGRIDSITKVYPEFKRYLPLDGTIGWALPANTPKDVLEAFGKGFEEVMNSPEMNEYIAQRGAVKINIWGEHAKDYYKRMESNFAWLTKDVGLANVDPATLGIPRP